MTKKTYIVQSVEGFAGVEFLADNPHHRRIYGPGEEVELDDKVHDIKGMLATGIIRLPDPPTKPEGGSSGATLLT